MTVDPKQLAASAVQTFNDDFTALSLYNGTSGTWSTTYPWVDPASNGGSLNDEQQWYVNSRFAPTAAIKPWSVANSILTIVAEKAAAALQPLINNYKYTSGVLTTYKSFSQLYGYFEARCQLPKGQGTWPAFWMDQATAWDWPTTGATWPPEIDVLEVLGKDTKTLYQTVHTGVVNQSIGKVSVVADMSAGFHTYGVGWWHDYTIFYFDREEVFRLLTPVDCHRPMFMILDLALGGGWGGPVDSTTQFPAKMLVDYVSAYKAADGSVLAPPVGQVPPVVPPASVQVLTGQVTGQAGDLWEVKVTKLR